MSTTTIGSAWKVVSPPISREAVDWVSIRSVQSLWPHIVSVIHDSVIQHSDSITACSQHRVIRWLLWCIGYCVLVIVYWLLCMYYVVLCNTE